ncbi:MAG: bifunctional (p)ppGpp synthetase/guanosine-3',5'-bis(diphosphate) 3'-pyrophosphohydrolase [Mariprofundaceae bacterium]|nr:bifunctional (p)ppGpp synthetase/guanosine-3',5'-bis(diphosphate) 3'-pyrophosphohydrolase [Mariprofundaceae bacterium]
MSDITSITQRLKGHHPDADLERVQRAYAFAAQAHSGQVRSSGEPYIIHPIEVARILSDLGMDEDSIITALLHDTVEDTSVTLDDIRELFGEEVVCLVDGLTKVGQISFSSNEQKQVENFRKMILATAQDLRVLLVKLADRLHNMRTLNFLKEAKQRSIATETLQIYAPLAHRLGIHRIKQEMEDASFSFLEPEAYKRLSKSLALGSGKLLQNKSLLEQVLQGVLEKQGIDAKVQGRIKHLYSLFNKMKKKGLDNLDKMDDLVAFRIIVKDLPTCYLVLGVIHSIYSPVPGRFKDYIGLPKPNGYQSLHTSIHGLDKSRAEVQIRTESMHQYAEDGIAAHWAYKEKDRQSSEQEKFQWLKRMTDMLQEDCEPAELVKNMRIDLFIQEVYVFSRDGDIFVLPRKAMPLDFAYHVHTDVGHHCIGVRVNGREVDLSTHLRNGDQIEIITSPDQSPSRQWLKYACTSRARHAIRQWFRVQERQSCIHLGQEMLQQASGRKISLPNSILRRMNCDDMDGLMEKLGRSEISLDEIFVTTNQERPRWFNMLGFSKNLRIPSECCRPIPGDPVVGMFKSGVGIIIHHQSCEKVTNKESKQWLDVRWEGEESSFYAAKVQLRSRNKTGMLARTSLCIEACQVNIEDLTLDQTSGGGISTVNMLLHVRSCAHLDTVIEKLKEVDGVMSAKRQFNFDLPKINLTVSDNFKQIFFRNK